MKEPNDHLNIDLDFLDKKEPVRVAKKPDFEPGKTPTSSSSALAPTGAKWNWKNILIIGSVVLFFGWAIFSDSSDSSSGSSYTPTTSENSNNVVSEGGQTFRCSDSDYDRAMQLKPSLTLGAQLASESGTLDSQIAASKAEKTDIENTYVDEDNEYEVDAYNEKVDAYNIERQRLITAGDSWDQRHSAFGKQIDAYNNYLDVNCRPQ